MLSMPWQRRDEKASTAGALALLQEVGLASRMNDLAGSLAYGEQRRLEIARALGTNPGVLLLDEPAAGTNPVEKRELAELISRINTDRDISVLLIEHDMNWSCRSPTASSCSTSGRRSPREPRTRSSATPWSSRPTWARPRKRRGAGAEQPELHLIGADGVEEPEPADD